VRDIIRELTIVLTADCDLQQDFHGRLAGLDEEQHTIIPHALLFDLHERPVIRGRFQTGDTSLWKRVQRNQDIRYYHFETAPINGTKEELPDLYVDFRKGFGIPLDQLYASLSAGAVQRVARVPDVHVHDLMQRCYSYLARVASPD
jgi:hypothetical protein